MTISKPKELIESATPAARAVIGRVLEIENEGKHYKSLPSDLERDFCERIIKVIKNEIKQ